MSLGVYIISRYNSTEWEASHTAKQWSLEILVHV